MYKAVTASPMCTKAVSASIKTGREEMLSGMTLCLICSSLIHGLTRRSGNVRINAFLEDVRRIRGLACNFRAVYVKSNEINKLDHALYLRQHLFKLFIKFYS